MKDGFLSLFYPQGPQLWLAAIAGINAAFRPRAAPRPPRAGLSIPAQHRQRRAGSSPLGALFFPSGHEKDHRALIPSSITTKQTQPRCCRLLLIRLCILQLFFFPMNF